MKVERYGRGRTRCAGRIFEIFSRIAQKNVTVDMIVQNVADAGKADISFTVPRDELPITLRTVQDAQSVLGQIDVSYDEQVAKVSAVGREWRRNLALPTACSLPWPRQASTSK